MKLPTLSLPTLHLCIVLLVQYVTCQDRKEESIFVKPGAGTLSVEHELNGYKCQFTYAAQGGTHENWAFSMELLDGGMAVMCVLERGQSSYLFFEHFTMNLSGPGIAITEVDMLTSGRDNKQLAPSEYTKEANAVSSSKQFKNHLEKVAVYSPLPHSDL